MPINIAASFENAPVPAAQVSAPASRKRYALAYFESLLIALLLCWSPSNALGYLAPSIVLGWYIFRSRSQNALINAILWVVGWIVVIGIYALFSDEFALSSAVLVLLTYSAFAPLFVVGTRTIADRKIWSTTLRVLSWVVLLQATLGLIQAIYGFSRTGSFYGSNGDFVEGTIHPWLAAELAFSNPMFAVNMAFMLLALLPSVIMQRKYRLAFFFGGFVLVLASVLHVLYLLFGAFVIAIALYFPTLLKYKSGLLFGLIAVMSVGIAYTAVGARLDLAQNFWQLNLTGRTPRGIVTDYAFDEIPEEYPLMPLFGIGPGQFSSRAGLIGSGLYFGRTSRPRSIPLMPTSMSPVFRKYVYDVWVNDPRPPGLRSSSTQPYFSWLSVYVEFGGIATAALVLWSASLLWRLRRFARRNELRMQTIALGSGIMFFLFLGMQENYWEIPQAILVGLLLLKLQYANMRAQYYELQLSITRV